MTERDAAELANLEGAISQLLPGLDEFLAFHGGDRSIEDRPTWTAALDGPLPTDGVGLDAVLDELRDHVIPYGQRSPHPGFSAYIIGRATTAPVAAGLAAQVAGHFRYFLTSFSFLEELSLRWLAELCQLPDGMLRRVLQRRLDRQPPCHGRRAPGGFRGDGVDVAADGIPPGTRTRVYGSHEVHHTIQRSTGVLGMGRRAFMPLASDLAGRLDPAALDAQLALDRAAGIVPVAVVAVAGTTATGAIDDIAATRRGGGTPRGVAPRRRGIRAAGRRARGVRGSLRRAGSG